MNSPFTPCRWAAQKMQELSVADDTPGFLEATVYAKDKAVIMCGEFAEATKREPRAKINSFNRWYKPWYYKHVEKCLETGPFEEFRKKYKAESAFPEAYDKIKPEDWL